MLDGLGLSEPKGFAFIYPTHRSSKTTRCTFFFIAEELYSRHDACSLLRSVSRLISDLYLESLKDILYLSRVGSYHHMLFTWYWFRPLKILLLNSRILIFRWGWHYCREPRGVGAGWAGWARVHPLFLLDLYWKGTFAQPLFTTCHMILSLAHPLWRSFLRPWIQTKNL